MAFKLMSNYSRLQEVKKENKEKDKVRREKLAGLFFDLAKLSFAGLVVGGVSTIIFIRIGNTILK